ncbi:hypothetical protein [Aquipuribacter hungaricus]|uniref:Uncharacterized protein n=1 Tax=Aquipuribacter hungaricus TaxID=545624 RepID=A0ABV7WFC7_9MICO
MPKPQDTTPPEPEEEGVPVDDDVLTPEKSGPRPTGGFTRPVV